MQHRFTVAGIKADAQKAKEGGGVYDPRGAGAAWYGTLSALCRPRVLVLHTSLLMVSGVLALASAPKQGQVKLGQVVPLFINWRMAMQSRARPSVEVTALSCLACLPVSHRDAMPVARRCSKQRQPPQGSSMCGKCSLRYMSTGLEELLCTRPAYLGFCISFSVTDRLLLSLKHALLVPEVQL